MHFQSVDPWRHSHSFGQEKMRGSETRVRFIVILTAGMMVLEVAAGIAFGSMALLADGLHMASHAAALGIAAFAYAYARRYAADPRYSFGTGKVNALGGFTGALLLAIFALAMAWESIQRMLNPVEIAFDQAVVVAVLGLAVNGVSAWVLSKGNGAHAHLHHDHDHNLRSAYLHVLADALTSFLAIFALLSAKYFGAIWMDPLMGIVGAALVTRWSWGLLRSSGAVLLDRQAPAPMLESLRGHLESDRESRVSDLHLWSIGLGVFSAAVSVVTDRGNPPEYYKRRIPADLGIGHLTVEVNPCRGGNAPARPQKSGLSAPK